MWRVLRCAFAVHKVDFAYQSVMFDRVRIVIFYLPNYPVEDSR